MERKRATRCDNIDQSHILRMAENFIRAPDIIDQDGTVHHFQAFQWLGNWGICNADRTKIFVKAKANYQYAKVLPSSQVLIAGTNNFGWDVYSPTGELLEHLSPMSCDEAADLLYSRKRNG